MSLPESFLATNGLLNVFLDVVSGLVVNEGVIGRRLADELPFLATEEILMRGVKAGGDRQELHERIRQHAHASAAKMKETGEGNDLMSRLKGDKAFAKVDLAAVVDPARFIGRAPQQVDEFLAEVVEPIRKRYADDLGAPSDLHV